MHAIWIEISWWLVLWPEMLGFTVVMGLMALAGLLLVCVTCTRTRRKKK